jgi:hypothetical protein
MEGQRPRAVEERMLPPTPQDMKREGRPGRRMHAWDGPLSVKEDHRQPEERGAGVFCQVSAQRRGSGKGLEIDQIEAVVCGSPRSAIETLTSFEHGPAERAAAEELRSRVERSPTGIPDL